MRVVRIAVARRRRREARTRRALGGASETSRPGPRRAAIRRGGWARGEARGGLAQRDRTRPRRARVAPAACRTGRPPAQGVALRRRDGRALLRAIARVAYIA